MQNIFDIHDYDEHFLDQFTSNIIPIYDLWSIHPLQNDTKLLASGTSEDVEKFREFIIKHAEKENPHPLLIIIGAAEKSNPNNILHSKKSYYKLKFEKSISNDYGTPILLSGYPQRQEHMQALAGYGNPNQNQFSNPYQAPLSYTEIQGIIDKNVSDATRSIRAEYDEISAKREIDNYKQMAALETKMEMYKLEMKANELSERERKLKEEQELFEMERLEGMDKVKDYTKTIAGGLFELGKTAFGIEDKDDKKGTRDKGKEEKSTNTTEKSDLGTTSFDDDGFAESNNPQYQNRESNNENAFNSLMGVIANLNDEQKYQLLDVLMPEEVEQEAPSSSEKLNVESEKNENKSNEPQVTSDEKTAND